MNTLEKIKAEIANLTCDCINGMVNQYAVLQIIDKYAEQEQTDTWSIKDVADTLAKHGLIREQEPCENCCNGDQIEKAKLCQKSYLAGMEHKQEPCDDVVSRDAVIAWFCNQRCGCGCVDRKSCPILVGIRELPAVTQKPAERDDAINRQAVLDCATLITSIPTEDWDIGDWVCLFRDRVSQLPPVRPQEPIPEQWQELKETILEMRDNDGTGTQQEVCKFLANYMAVLEKQMVEPTCDTCEYNTAAFNPCNACDNKSLFEPQERGKT